MIEYSEIMVDLETMSTKHNAAIVSIGAVEMDFKNKTLGKEPFYINIDLKSSQDAGLHIDADTVNWWMMQKDDARKALTGNRESLIDALTDFYRWLQKIGGVCRIWGNGANFDNVILRNAYEAVGVTCPWPFWNDMCYRTIKNMHPDVWQPTRSGTYHNALDDATFQAEHLLGILRRKLE